MTYSSVGGCINEDKVKGNQRAERGKVENNTPPRLPLLTRLIRHSPHSSTQLLLSHSSRLYLYQPKVIQIPHKPSITIPRFIPRLALPTGWERNIFLRHLNLRSSSEKESIWNRNGVGF